MAIWLANSMCEAGERVMISTGMPFSVACRADASKKSVAVLKTPVISGGVQPMVIFGISAAKAPPLKTRIISKLIKIFLNILPSLNGKKIKSDQGFYWLIFFWFFPPFLKNEFFKKKK